MAKLPRTGDELRPYLLDIHQIWLSLSRHDAFLWVRGLQRKLLGPFLILTALVGVSIATIYNVFTDVRHEVTTQADCDIKYEDGTRVVYLTFPDFPQFAAEAVISERLVQHLDAKHRNTVRVTMMVVYDFGEARTKGPALTADGINLDE